MKILSIDSTSAVARVALTNDSRLLKEVVSPRIHWDAMVSGNVDLLMEDFLEILDVFFDDMQESWDDLDLICYSGFSGFKVSMDLGKMLARMLGSFHKIEVRAVDHISSHYFSLFVNQEEHGHFPKLIYSASWSHNSLVYMKNMQELTILNDHTYFEEAEGKYIGLGSIFNRVLRSLDILREDQTPQEIPELLSSLDSQYVDEIVDEFRILYIPKNVFDLDMYEYYQACNKKMMLMKSKYDAAKIFFSFQRSLFDILAEKFDQVSELMNVSEVAIVWWISQNDHFVDYLEAKSMKVHRPLEAFRFDNAAMLWVLLFHQEMYGREYPISHIVT